MGALKPGELRAPEKLAPEHDLAAFDSGETMLDEWLRRGAAQNGSSGASRTYVVCAGKRAAGYYSLAVGAATHEQVASRIKRNMPDKIPVMILGHLAVDRTFQGKGIGAGLLKDAVLRTMQAANIAGMRALLVHAISDAAKGFYEAFGFIASPIDPMTQMITLVEAERIILRAKGSE
jgi:GNAT superfamily N-acetyltransferase